MGRPRKIVRDTEKPARSFNEIQRIVEMALKLFELTGGLSLDLQLRSMDRTAEMYQLQTDAALQYGQDPGAYGPTVNPYEARMSASSYARLNAQREAKMAQCMAWAEEGAQAAEERKANGAQDSSGTGNPAGGTEPGEAELEREASASGREAATVKPEAAASAESSREATGRNDDGDLPDADMRRQAHSLREFQSRGQSPNGGQSPNDGTEPNVQLRV